MYGNISRRVAQKRSFVVMLLRKVIGLYGVAEPVNAGLYKRKYLNSQNDAASYIEMRPKARAEIVGASSMKLPYIMYQAALRETQIRRN